MLTRTVCMTLLALVLSGPGLAQTADEALEAHGPAPRDVVSRQVTESGVLVARLDNGMTVILKENRALPVLHVQCSVRAGGMYEGPWLGTGISHLTEHLVAKGATRGGGHLQAESDGRSRIDEIGAQSNAYTSLGRTVYYIACAAGRADEAVDILADWMARPEITEEAFEREHGVVQRELEMGRDNADRQHYYAQMANAFAEHPASVPVIGYAGALAGLTYQDVLDYHARMYVPQRMIFTAVGDFDSEAMLQRICAALAGFEAGRMEPTVLPPVGPIEGVRRVVIEQPTVDDVAESIALRSIPLHHPDLYALDVLSYVLTNGESSRLHRTVLREQELVTEVSSYSWTPAWGDGVFGIEFRAEPDQADAAEAAILTELARVADEGITEEELAKAKRQKVADYVYAQQTVDAQAATLDSDYRSTGDIEFSRRYTERIQAVTAEQVQQAARQYFRLDAMAITRMVGRAERDRAGAGAARDDRAERFTLDNGLTVVLGPTDSVELVSMCLAVKGGLMVEGDATNGLGTLMTELSLQGAGDLSAEEIAGHFDAAGGAIGAESGNNTFLWRATTLADEADDALAIFADVVIRPTFAADELQLLRPRVLAAEAQIDESWMGTLQKTFRQAFFGAADGHPYQFMTLGRAEVLAGASVEDIAAHHGRYVRAGNAVLTVYGRFDADAMRGRIEELFASMPGGAVELEIPSVRQTDGDERVVLEHDQQQAAIMIGWPGMTLDNAADRDAIDVLDTIISGWRLPTGWLHAALRGRQLVYVVHAYNWSGFAPGAFVVYAATQPEQAPEVVGIIRENIARTLSYDFTEDEIDRAVNMILTAELLGNQSMSALAQQAALDELYGFGYDYQQKLEPRLRAVTGDDLRRVAETYLGQGAVEVIVTPQPGLLESE